MKPFPWPRALEDEENGSSLEKRGTVRATAALLKLHEPAREKYEQKKATPSFEG